MYKRIVLAYDGSEAGQHALLDCKEIAQLAQAELHLIAVVPPHLEVEGGEGSNVSNQLDQAERARFSGILDEGLARLKEAGYSAIGEIGYGDPVLQVTDYATKVKVDLIVVGHKHKTGWAKRWWRRSVSRSMIETAPCSLLVVITP